MKNLKQPILTLKELQEKEKKIHQKGLNTLLCFLFWGYIFFSTFFDSFSQNNFVVFLMHVSSLTSSDIVSFLSLGSFFATFIFASLFFWNVKNASLLSELSEKDFQRMLHMVKLTPEGHTFYNALIEQKRAITYVDIKLLSQWTKKKLVS